MKPSNAAMRDVDPTLTVEPASQLSWWPNKLPYDCGLTVVLDPQDIIIIIQYHVIHTYIYIYIYVIYSIYLSIYNAEYDHPFRVSSQTNAKCPARPGLPSWVVHEGNEVRQQEAVSIFSAEAIRQDLSTPQLSSRPSWKMLKDCPCKKGNPNYMVIQER